MAGIGYDSAFQRALGRFKDDLSPAQLEEFRVTSLEDVQETIVQIQNAQGSQRKMMNLTRIKAFLEAMEQYSKILEVFLNVSEFIAFVWGPIKWLLQIASTWVESLDVLLDAYEEISENLPQLLQYGELFEQHAHMRKVLELMYGDILQFHRRALKFFGRSTWKHLFHSSWKTFKTQFHYILGSLNRHKHLVESQASLVEYEQSKVARLAAENSFEEMAKAEKSRRYLAVAEKIHPPNTRTDHEGAVETRHEHPESGRWILQHRSLRDWMDFTRPDGPVLWINGIPGAGKTVIASLIIQEIENLDSVHLGFFYCKYSDNQKNSFTNVLRGILFQLVQQNEELLPYVYDACCSSSELTMNSQSLLKKLVETSLKSCPNTYIVIDGIDECEETEEKKIIAWFLAVSENVVKNSAETMHLLFISQRDKVTEKLLTQAAVISLDSKYHQEDIEIYSRNCATKIQRKFGISEASAIQIGTHVAAQAQGLFLFAKLVMTHLHDQTTREKLFRELQPDSFPTGLEAAYDRIALRIFENPNLSEREDAHNIFRWIICAKRPLKWNDIQSVFAIDPVQQRVDFDERQLRVTCRDLCGSLVESGARNTLELVHRSAKLYLIRTSRISLRSENLHIAEFCLGYLSFGCFDTTLTDSEIEEFLRLGYYSFEDYAIAHWLDHVDAGTSQPLQLETISFGPLAEKLEKFLMKHASQSAPHLSVSIDKRFKTIRNWSSTKRLDDLAHLARERQPNEDYLDLDTELRRRRLIYENIATSTNPLSNSFRKALFHNGSGLFKCPKFWCEFFSDGFQHKECRDEHVNQHERPFRCSVEECLYAKLGYGSEKELKNHEKKSHPTSQSSEWAFPVPRPKKRKNIFSAAIVGDLTTVKQLVEEGVDIDQRRIASEKSLTALSFAARHDHPDVVRYLLDRGSIVQPFSHIRDAVRTARISIIQMLVEEGRVEDLAVLAQAAIVGREDLIPLLLTYDIDIDQQYHGMTALQWARSSGHHAIVKILLENGARDETREPVPESPEDEALNQSEPQGNIKPQQPGIAPLTQMPHIPILPQSTNQKIHKWIMNKGNQDYFKAIQGQQNLTPPQQQQLHEYMMNIQRAQQQANGQQMQVPMQGQQKNAYNMPFNSDFNNSGILENFDYEQFWSKDARDYTFEPVNASQARRDP